MNSKNKLLITGATSFLGTHIATLLLNSLNGELLNFKIRAVTHRPENIDKFKSVLPVHKVEWIIADLTIKEEAE